MACRNRVRRSFSPYMNATVHVQNYAYPPDPRLTPAKDTVSGTPAVPPAGKLRRTGQKELGPGRARVAGARRRAVEGATKPQRSIAREVLRTTSAADAGRKKCRWDVLLRMR